MKNLIVITGGGGAGKTQLAKLLAEAYMGRKEPVTVFDGIELAGRAKREALKSAIEMISSNVIITMIDEYDPDTFPVRADRVIEVRKG